MTGSFKRLENNLAYILRRCVAATFVVFVDIECPLQLKRDNSCAAVLRVTASEMERVAGISCCWNNGKDRGINLSELLCTVQIIAVYIVAELPNLRYLRRKRVCFVRVDKGWFTCAERGFRKLGE